MDFGMSFELSKEIKSNISSLNDLSKLLKDFFSEKSYGESVERIVIGIICVHPMFDEFFQTRKKYNKNTGLLEYDIKLDFQSCLNKRTEEVIKMVMKRIIDSLAVFKELKITGFDVARFKKDLESRIRKSD
jgi:hypothetical protein